MGNEQWASEPLPFGVKLLHGSTALEGPSALTLVPIHMLLLTAF